MRMNKNGNLHEHERSLKTRLRLRSGIKLALEYTNIDTTLPPRHPI